MPPTKRLILLVGSSPLPNFLTCLALEPNEVALVYTDQTQPARDRLHQKLEEAMGQNVKFLDQGSTHIPDATDCRRVREIVEALARQEGTDSGGGSIHLNYTGGTKVMAAHARAAFEKAGGKPENASYLDGGQSGQPPILRRDNGTSESLMDFFGVSFDLETLLALHGATLTERSELDPPVSLEDEDAILGPILDDVANAGCFYDEKCKLGEMNLNQVKRRLREPDIEGIIPPTVLKKLRQAADNRNRRAVTGWIDFLGGTWLEYWLGRQIEDLALDPTPAVTVGVNAQRGPRRADLEVDVAVIRSLRTYFISCTTDTRKGLCKSKLFEVALRARHLGGDLARAALVCLADAPTTEALRADVADVWEASNTPEVFGLDDVRMWSDIGGRHPDRFRLQNWLES